MPAPIRIALIGMGKIAHDQHLPAIAGNPDFELVAAVSRHGTDIASIPGFTDIDGLIASGIGVDAVALCTPPQVRREIAARAMAQGWHVFLEKPPGASLAEVEALRAAAQETGVSLFASWHSRYADGVEPARAWLAGREIASVSIDWREDVRVWHPGQHWIWEPGGFGVFDPGINALSIVTYILPRPFFLDSAELDVPANCAAPIAVRATYRDALGAPVTMVLDFLQQGPQSRDIVVETDAGTLKLANGGGDLSIAGTATPAPQSALHGEYPGLYRRFAQLIRERACDVDVSPLRHVADAFMRGRYNQVAAFVE